LEVADKGYVRLHDRVHRDRVVDVCSLVHEAC
jgi:hypothetical protein